MLGSMSRGSSKQFNIPPAEMPMEAWSAMPSALTRLASTRFMMTGMPPIVITQNAYSWAGARVRSLAPMRLSSMSLYNGKDKQHTNASIIPIQKVTDATRCAPV